MPVTDLKSQRQQIDESIGSERALMMLLVFFGVFALLLACIGLHGVTVLRGGAAYREIGIRVALGAQRAARLLADAAAGRRARARRAAARHPRGRRGIAIGPRALFGVEPADPWSIAAGAGVLFAVALAAGFVPARRAARLDPLVALRRE